MNNERNREILKGINDAVIYFKKDACVQWCSLAISENISALDAIMRGLSSGMEKVKELYTAKDYFIPELLLCADAFSAGLELLKPHLDIKNQPIKRKLVIGVAEGDIHDIGKNLVKIMLIADGWEVYDLGKDVRPIRFIEEQQRTGAGLVAISALMSISMMVMPEIISMLKANDPEVRVMVGGAPLSEEIARKFGADGYAPDAGTSVRKAAQLMGYVGQ